MMAHFAPSFFFLALCAFLVKNANSDIQCLVSRAGYGLVSEHCPANTVGCRIRIQRNAVTFYDYLDSNQFVCVLKGEFGEQRGSGCVRKRSGNIRCWCFGRSNCNTAENSKLIYEAFVSGNEQKLLETVQQVDFADLAEMPKTKSGSSSSGLTTTVTAASTASSRTVASRAEKRNTSSSHTRLSSAAHTSLTKRPISSNTKIVNALFHRPHKEQKITHSSVTKTTAPMPSMIQNSTLQSEYDQRNRVHVIHVSSRDQYEPVFGSAALRRIMAQERERLKAESEAISAEIQDDYDEEDDLTSSSSSVLEDIDQRGDQKIQRRVAQRSELAAKPKGSRMEQREKSSSSSSSASGEGPLENALGDEYFDNSFVAPASSAWRPTRVFVHALHIFGTILGIQMIVLRQ